MLWIDDIWEHSMRRHSQWRAHHKNTIFTYIDAHLQNIDGTHVLKNDTGHGQERPRPCSSWSRAARYPSSRKARKVKPISIIPSKYAYLPTSFITNPYFQLQYPSYPVTHLPSIFAHILGTCRSAHEDMVSFSTGWAAIDECADQTGKLLCW